MTTLIRPEVSKSNKYWISKHRHYELKHFCLQYPEWKKAYVDQTGLLVSSLSFERSGTSNIPSDLTSKYAMKRAYYGDRINLIEKVAMDADKELYTYILKAVTEGLSYSYLKSKMNIPCGKDLYYDRYRRFFWLLNGVRN